jgi:FkbH-like protein
MYLQEQLRERAERAGVDYEHFLRSCNTEVSIRPYHPNDVDRIAELLTRTHRMNLGVLSLEQALNRLGRDNKETILVAEVRDRYGDMGRCGVLQLRHEGFDKAVVESLAISCRAKARGLSLSMLIGLLRHPGLRCHQLRCRYVANGMNRPLRMLLMAVGFKRRRQTAELLLSAERLAQTKVPEWIQIRYLLKAGV